MKLTLMIWSAPEYKAEFGALFWGNIFLHTAPYIFQSQMESRNAALLSSSFMS